MRWTGIAVDLRHAAAEEPAAIDIRLRAVDARCHPSPAEADQGQVPCDVARTVGGTAVGSARHPCRDAVASGAETNGAKTRG